MRNHLTTAELQAVVNEGSGQHTARQVASAVRELALRAGGEQAAFERKFRLSANACAILGAFFVIWPVLMLVLFVGSRAQPRAHENSSSFLFRHFDDFFLAIGVLQAFSGVLLLAGGLASR